MGSAESTMSVFYGRVKNDRSWSDKGLQSFLNFMIGLIDSLPIKTLLGLFERTTQQQEDSKPNFYKEKLTKAVEELTIDNIPYFKSSSGKPIYTALKGMQVFKIENIL